MQSEFVALNQTALYQIISSNFSGLDKTKTIEQIKKYILPKLKIFRGKSENKTIYFLEESEYVETEWKDMVSMHYVNTSYELKNTVIRCHVFSKKQFDAKHYLGFFTLRPIDEIKVMVSFVYPNWNNICISNEFDTYIMTYNKKVHIRGKIFNIRTYPVFCQDSVVTSCAHANIISMSKYLRVKSGVSKLRLNDINNSYVFERSKIYPTNGLGFRQMLEIFSKNNWHITYDTVLPCRKVKKDDYYKTIQENIDVNIESALPVLLNVTFTEEKTGEKVHHILQIVGHTSEEIKRYVIYDDSGIFANEIEGCRNFCVLLSWDEIVKALFSEGGFVLYPQYEKVYMMYNDIKERIEPILLKNNEESKADEEIVKNIYEKLKLSPEDSRYLLVDNVVVKSFLKDNVSDYESIRAIIEKNQSHYLWYCETKVDEVYLVFLADSTYNVQTTKNIFINQKALVLPKAMSLLSSYRKNPNYDDYSGPL